MFKVYSVKTIRVELGDDIYCQITPSVENVGCQDYFLYRRGYGVAEYMFTCENKTDDEAVELAVANAADFIPFLIEQCG